jgi:hypothetical protein
MERDEESSDERVSIREGGVTESKMSEIALRLTRYESDCRGKEELGTAERYVAVKPDRLYVGTKSEGTWFRQSRLLRNFYNSQEW